MKHLKNQKLKRKLKPKQKVPKTAAQKIRDYFIKKYDSTKNIFIRRETSVSIQVSEVRRDDKEK